MSPVLLHPDGLKRCPWPKQDPLYVAYHDDEWGVPEYDDRALYEKLILDGFQAGLSWITILRKRENFRRAFDGFEPEKIARYTPKKIAKLMQDAGIVRNRMKIEGAILSARAYLDAMEKGPGFSRLLWDFVGGRPKVNRFRSTSLVPAETPISRAMSKELARRGFKFVGPSIVYAFMQATGMVNDHVVSCHRHAPLAALAGRLARCRQSRERQWPPRHSALGNACCPGAGSICSIRPRSTSRSPTSRTGSRASPAGTDRPRARTSSPSRSIRCWSKPSRASARASTAQSASAFCCTTPRNT